MPPSGQISASAGTGPAQSDAVLHVTGDPLEASEHSHGLYGQGAPTGQLGSEQTHWLGGGVALPASHAHGMGTHGASAGQVGSEQVHCVGGGDTLPASHSHGTIAHGAPAGQLGAAQKQPTGGVPASGAGEVVTGGGGTACEKQSMTPLGCSLQQSPGSPSGTCHPVGHGAHCGGGGVAQTGVGGQTHELAGSPPSGRAMMAGQLQTDSFAQAAAMGEGAQVVPWSPPAQHVAAD